MIHKGIEHGMVSAIAEAFNIMRDGLGMELDEIADVYEKWNKEGELVCPGVLLQSSCLMLMELEARHIPHRHQHRHMSEDFPRVERTCLVHSARQGPDTFITTLFQQIPC